MGKNDGGVVTAVKIVDHGPELQNWNLVITGDGFTLDELGDFVTVVDDFVAFLQTQSPFNGPLVWDKVNIHRVDVVSDESGTDHPDCDQNIEVDTYFDAELCANGIDRLMDINAGLVQEEAAVWVPEWDALLVFVNTSVRGGKTVDGVAVRTLSSDANRGALHELGHAAFGLADEYPYSEGCDSGETGHDTYTGTEPLEPNVTTSLDLADLEANEKWAIYVDASTPLPTTRNPDCTQCDDQASPVADGTVGLFEGARYFHCGLFRPEYDCRMNNNSVPFCTVCNGVIFSVIVIEAPCWVTTAVYGDPLHPDVVTLRRWRDRQLAPGARGAPAMRLLAAGYARVGPILARLTQPRPHLAHLLRTLVFAPWARALRRREGTVP